MTWHVESGSPNNDMFFFLRNPQFGGTASFWPEGVKYIADRGTAETLCDLVNNTPPHDPYILFGGVEP
jgi:hypothetical protein